jgi:hypothetical protein
MVEHDEIGPVFAHQRSQLGDFTRTEEGGGIGFGATHGQCADDFRAGTDDELAQLFQPLGNAPFAEIDLDEPGPLAETRAFEHQASSLSP